MLSLVVALALAAAAPEVDSIAEPEPVTLTIASGPLQLRAMVWQPKGSGPFPAVFFNHGSYATDDPMPSREPETLGPLFARHGYVFMFLFRQGSGLSAGQGTAEGDQMRLAFDRGGQSARNDVQMRLLLGEELDASRAALAWLMHHPSVDTAHVAVVGHSFGGSLSLMQAEIEPALRAIVLFGAAAASWEKSPPLRERLLASLAKLKIPIYLAYAKNDYSLVPARAMATELDRLGKPHELKIYPEVGDNSREGHNFLYGSVSTWEENVFGFLDRLLRPASEF